MKKLIILLLLVPAISFADEESFPIFEGLKIVSEKDMPKALRIDQKQLSKQKSQDENRYANFLFGLKQNASNEIKAYRKTTNAYDTHLKQSLAEIPLAFTYKKIPLNDNEIIGYAAIGSFVKEPKEGWNGIKVFFDSKEIGSICAYEFTDLTLSHGGVLITKESIKRFINNKISTASYEGNDKVGYVYSVTWYNDIKVSRLDCVTRSFQKDTIALMLKLANKIDKA